MDPRAAQEPNKMAGELERQKQYFQSLLAASPVAIVMTDVDARVTAWNPAAERLFGYGEHEAVGVPIDDLIANRDALITPGIRPGGSAAADQVPGSTAAKGAHAGRDLRVIGRPIASCAV